MFTRDNLEIVVVVLILVSTSLVGCAPVPAPTPPAVTAQPTFAMTDTPVQPTCVPIPSNVSFQDAVWAPHTSILAVINLEGIGGICLYDVAALRKIHFIQGQVQKATFSPDGKTLAWASMDNTVRLWDVATGRERLVLIGPPFLASGLAFSSDSKTLALATWDKAVKLWEVATGRELDVFTEYRYEVQELAFSPDSKTLAAKSSEAILLWNVTTGRQLDSLAGFTNTIRSMAWSPDGKLIAAGSQFPNLEVRLWEVATGHEFRVLSGHQRGWVNVAFSPDGKTLASAGYETVKLWDVATGRELYSVSASVNSLRTVFSSSLAFSPDGKLLGSRAGLLDAATGRRLELPAQFGAFSPDGKLVAGVSTVPGHYGVLQYLHLVDVATGREIHIP